MHTRRELPLALARWSDGARLVRFLPLLAEGVHHFTLRSFYELRDGIADQGSGFSRLKHTGYLSFILHSHANH